MKHSTRARLARMLAALAAAGALAGCPDERASSPSSPSSSSSSGGASADDRFVGEHRGQELTLKLERAGSGYKGTILRAGKTFPVEAERKGEGLAGSFESEGNKFAFELEREGEASLSLKTAGKVYRLAAQPRAKNPLAEEGGPANPLAGPANPLGDEGGVAKGPQAKPARPAKTAADEGWFGGKREADPKDPQRGGPVKPTQPEGERPEGEGPRTSDPPPHTPARSLTPADATIPAGWKSASARGATLHYPPDWQINPVGDDSVQLIPGDVKKNEQGGHDELFVIRGVPATGVERPDDPKAVEWLDNSVRQQFPILSRQGEPRRVGQAVLFVYAGDAPNGSRIEARCYVKIVDGMGFLIMALALPDQMQRRAATLDRIAAAFAFKRPPNDQRMVGQWRHTGGTVTKDFSSVSERYLLLRADGRCFSSSRYMAGHTSRNQLGDATGRTLVDTGEGAGWEKQGTWSGPVGGGLTLAWSDGTSESWGAVEVMSQMLLLKPSAQAKKGLLFERTR